MTDDLRRPEGIIPLDEEIIQFTAAFGLSVREADVLRLLLSGVVTAGDMGSMLKISPHTVNNHLTSIFDKTGTASKTEIVSTFVRHVLSKLNHCKLFTQRPKVLVIDDEPEVGKVISEFLTLKGVQVWTEVDPRKVPDMVREMKLDFVVSDIDMPGMTGLALLKEIRLVHRRSPMVIFITGKPDYSAEGTLDLGAVSFIAKPCDPTQLFFTIMEHFIEGAHERSRLLRVDARVPVLVDKVYSCTTTNLGFGGVFLPFDGDLEAMERKLKVGDRLSFDLKLSDDTPPTPVLGEIVWRRNQPGLDLAAGIGVKFIEMAPEVRHAVEDYVRLNKISSFIPLGSPPPRRP